MHNYYSKIMTVINEISNDEELTAGIVEYGRLTDEIAAKLASIQDTLDSIKALEKQSSSSLKNIERYVVDFQKTKVVADKWVLNVQNELKYKRLAPQYKELWEEALSKLNPATKAVLEKLKEAHLDAKSKETIDKISISKVDEASFMDNVISVAKSFLSKLVSFIPVTKQYKQVVNNLPKV